MSTNGVSEDDHSTAMVVCRVGQRLCGLPVGAVIETMRVLPIEPVAAAPAFVLGLAIIRGEPVPVVDAAQLLGAASSIHARFVTLRLGTRRVALAVDGVLGVHRLAADALALPPLLGEAAAEIVAAIGTHDEQLLLVLRTSRLVSESVLDALVAEAS
jgi:purine-binding chemotaxis protein CheW